MFTGSYLSLFFVKVFGIPTGAVATMLLILGLGGLLTVPLMPVRSLMVAAMVHQLKDEGENTGP